MKSGGMRGVPGFTSVVKGGPTAPMGMADGGKVKKGKKPPPFAKGKGKGKVPAAPSFPMMPGYKDGGKAKGKC